MKGLQYALDLVDRTFGPTIKKAKAQTKGLDNAMRNVAVRANAADAASNRSFSNIGGYARKAAAAVGLVFALSQVSAFASSVEATGAKFQGFENAINFASGEDGAKNLSFLNGQVKNLSLDMPEAYQGFQTLAGSMMGTKLAGQGVRDIFEAIAIAGRVNNLTGEQAQGTYLALSQIASKGVVSMEELRQQLAERIPGALKIGADAMGMAIPEFNKLVESGKLSAEVFLPRFAKAMKERFAGGVAEAVDSLQASKDRSNNAFISMKRNVADNMEGSIKAWNGFKEQLFTYIPQIINQLKPLIDSIINLATNAMDGTSGMGKAFAVLGRVIGVFSEGFGFMIDHWKIFTPLIVGATAVLGYYKLAAIAAIAQTSIWTVIQTGLNAALIANPIGIVVMAIAALVGGIIYAYKKVDWFRGGIDAMSVAMIGFAKNIKDYVITRFYELLEGVTGVATAIKVLFTDGFEKAAEVGKEAMGKLWGSESRNQFVKDAWETGMAAGMSYGKGVKAVGDNEGLDSAVSKNANDTLLGGTAGNTANTPTGNTGGATGTTASVAGSGGSVTKHTTFNIQSMVQSLTVQTTNLTGNPADVKAQLERIFLELMGDLELRASS